MFLDSLSERLEVYKIHSLIKIFPELIKPAFTHCGPLCPADLVNKIVPCDTNLDDMIDLVTSLFDIISDLSEEGAA